MSNTINAVTGLGVISGIKALATDFAGYTADQIEHHASTMPHDMGGWWIQPNPPGTLASVRRGGMAEKTAKCEAYVKRGSLI